MKKKLRLHASTLNSDRNDPFVYIANVIRGKIKMNKYDLSSAETNDIVVKILHAARRSAKTGMSITWSDYYEK